MTELTTLALMVPLATAVVVATLPRSEPGLVLGLALLLGWLYGKRDVASVLPSDDYGFGGLRPKLIRAGGNKARAQPTADGATESEAIEDAASTPVAAEPAPPPSEEGVP
ncbi:MAG TPA: hypothetical protein VM869_22830 [Enhygromyxa sp.]|nr:hypothetical protein [Enhygromyxa sp.]